MKKFNIPFEPTGCKIAQVFHSANPGSGALVTSIRWDQTLDALAILEEDYTMPSAPNVSIEHRFPSNFSAGFSLITESASSPAYNTADYGNIGMLITFYG